MAADGLTRRTAPAGAALSYAARKAEEMEALGLAKAAPTRTPAAAGEVEPSPVSPVAEHRVPELPAPPVQVPGRREPAVTDLAAEPGVLAAACTRAGYPELIAGLLERRASMGQVMAAIENAQLVSRIGRTLGLEQAAAKAVMGGMSAEVFADVAHTAKANADAAFVTNTTPPAKPLGAGQPQLNAERIYERMNGTGSTG